MKSLALLFAGGFLAAQLSAQSDSLQRTETGNFKHIEVTGSATVQIIPSDKFGFSSKGGQGAVVTNNGNTLSINGSTNVFVFTNSVESLTLRGSGKVVSSDTLKLNKLDISATGSGKMQLMLDCSSINFDLAGSPTLSLIGKSGKLNGSIAGSAEVKAYRLIADTVNLSIAGSGEAKVNVLQSLKGSIAGSGKIYYTGNPIENNVSVIGSGSVNKSNGIAANDTAFSIRVFNKEIILMDEDDKISLKMDDENNETPQKSGGYFYNTIWNGLELGVNGYLNANNSITLTGQEDFNLRYNRSIAVNINLFEQHLPIVKKHVYLVSGLGLEFNNYRLQKNIRFSENTNTLQYVIEDSIKYQKNKLAMSILNIPVYLSFRTGRIGNTGKQLMISPGIVGGWIFSTHQKRVVDTGNGGNRSKTHDNFNTEPFRLSASARLSYGNFVAFANYSLTRLFSKDKGPELYPFSVGVRLVGF